MTRTNTTRTGAQIAAGCLAALGLGIAVQAAAVPVRAAVAQAWLEQAFTQGQPAHQVGALWPVAGVTPVARLSVARLGVHEVVLSGGSLEAMAYGPTVIGSQSPGATARVVVMAAHRDTHFRFIRDLVPGDVVRVEAVGGGSTRYRVTGFQTVRWDQFTLPAKPRRRLLALATCYPFAGKGHGPWRRIVWAQAMI